MGKDHIGKSLKHYYSIQRIGCSRGILSREGVHLDPYFRKINYSSCIIENGFQVGSKGEAEEMEGRLFKAKRFCIVDHKGQNQETGMKEIDSSDFLGVKLLDLGDPGFPMRWSLSSLENETPARVWLKE